MTEKKVKKEVNDLVFTVDSSDRFVRFQDSSICEWMGESGALLSKMTACVGPILKIKPNQVWYHPDVAIAFAQSVSVENWLKLSRAIRC